MAREKLYAFEGATGHLHQSGQFTNFDKVRLYKLLSGTLENRGGDIIDLDEVRDVSLNNEETRNILVELLDKLEGLNYKGQYPGTYNTRGIELHFEREITVDDIFHRLPLQQWKYLGEDTYRGIFVGKAIYAETKRNGSALITFYA